jgi:hypothetical protein
VSSTVTSGATSWPTGWTSAIRLDFESSGKSKTSANASTRLDLPTSLSPTTTVVPIAGSWTVRSATPRKFRSVRL